MVDIESDGPIPGDFSMVCFGAVLVDENLETTFYGKLKPISEKFNPDALAVSGFTREETMNFNDPEEVMLKFEEWIKENSKGRPVFISDNNGLRLDVYLLVFSSFHRKKSFRVFLQKTCGSVLRTGKRHFCPVETFTKNRTHPSSG